MQTILRSGRYIYCLALAGPGFIHFLFQQSLSALIPLPPTLPALQAWVYVIGGLLIAGSICISFRIGQQVAALTIAMLFMLIYLLLHLPLEIKEPRNPASWTGAFEAIALAASALIFLTRSRGGAWSKFLVPILLASTLVVIGIQHFLYADFIATIIPSWIPFRLFLANFIGVAFFAAAFSLLTNIFLQYAMRSLALLFAIFVIVLHLPRVWKSPRVETEWTSLFIAVAMCGISLAWAARKKRTPV